MDEEEREFDNSGQAFEADVDEITKLDEGIKEEEPTKD